MRKRIRLLLITLVALAGFLASAPRAEGTAGLADTPPAAPVVAAEPSARDLCTWFRPYGAGIVYRSEVMFRYREDVNLDCSVAYSTNDCYSYGVYSTDYGNTWNGPIGVARVWCGT